MALPEANSRHKTMHLGRMSKGMLTDHKRQSKPTKVSSMHHMLSMHYFLFIFRFLDGKLLIAYIYQAREKNVKKKKSF